MAIPSETMGQRNTSQPAKGR